MALSASGLPPRMLSEKAVTVMKQRLSSLAILVGLLVLAACAAKEEVTPITPTPEVKERWEEEWEQVVAAAKREGKVAVAGQAGAEIRQALREPFERKYGIAVEYLGMSGSEFAPRLTAERQAGQYLWDVHIGGTSTMINTLKPAGAMDPIEPALILPEVKDPKVWRGGQLAFADKDRLLLLMIIQSSEALWVNTNLVRPEDVKSYRDLLDPKWKGKILAHDPRVAGGGQAKFQFMYVHPELGPDFIRALAKQELALSRDHQQLAQWLAEGKGTILLGSSRVTEGVMQAGAPIKPIDARQMKEGGSTQAGTAGGLALVNRAPHPNAAKVYINWLLSREGQTSLARALQEPSRRLDVPTDFVPAWSLPVDRGINADGEEMVRQRVEVLVPFLREAFGP